MIAITGGTGFLGGWLIQTLLEQNQSLRVLCRKPPQEAWANDPRVSIVLGDIVNRADLDPLVRGADQLYHIAGRVDFNPDADGLKLLRAVNVDGTRNVMQACLAHQVPRVVHVSSCSTIGAATSPESPLTELDFGKGLGLDIPYPASKHAGEQVVLEYVKQGVPAVIVNPTFFAGPGDKYLSSARTIVSFLLGQVWVGLNRGGMGYTDVRDIVAGMTLAMAKGRIGERYILGGTNLKLVEYHNLLAEVTKRRPPPLRLPPSWASPLSVLGKYYYRYIWGLPVYVAPGDIRLAQNYWMYHYTKAETELGLKVRSPRESLTEAVDWLLSPEGRNAWPSKGIA